MNMTQEEYKLSRSCYIIMKTHWRDNYDNYFYEGVNRDVFDIYEKNYHEENSDGYYLRSNETRSFHFVKYMVEFMADSFVSNPNVYKIISSLMNIDDASYYIHSNIVSMIINALVHDSFLISLEKLRNVFMKKLEYFIILRRTVSNHSFLKDTTIISFDYVVFRFI